MYKRPDNNPFGEWNKIPEPKDNMSLNEQEEFDSLWKELCIEDISESETSNYLERLHEGYAEQGWWGVSPFAWTEGFKIGNIFKPLKWLALPLVGGVVLLLAGIWKLLKEGKKQIAIARVRAWIQKLVVTADSGLKKTRNTKDSLFLIRQRYRRDILQGAVKVATALGLGDQIEEKDTKPEEVETSVNESEDIEFDNDGQQDPQNDQQTSVSHQSPTAIPGQVMLPDDMRVDWSLMNSVKASQWFGLKHKTTNFWKEAKSVAVIEDQQGNALRFCGLLVSQVSMSLTLIANQGVAQNYASIMNKYIETLSNVKTSDSAAMNSYSYRDDRRFSSRGMSESEKTNYKMFEEDFKIFEAAGTPGDNKQKISEWISNSDFVAYLKEINQYNYVMNIIMTMRDKPEVEKSSFDFIKSLYDQYSIKNVEDMVNDFSNEQQQSQQTSQLSQQPKPAGIDSSNVDKYLIAALSKVLANTDYTQWNVHADAYKQMLKFIDELTKTVHTIIDSVAKKVEDKIGSSGNTFEQAVLRFVSSNPDAKQNRSLKNLWDNIGVSKLQQRTVVHCQEIVASPEMQYYLDMFMITVPSIIKSKIAGVAQQLPQQQIDVQQESNMGA